MSIIDQKRKNEHVALAQKFYHKTQPDDFDRITLIHHSLPTVNLDQVSLQTSFAGLSFDAPFYINAVTGGSQRTKKINGDLSLIARETGLAMATGSVSSGLKNPDTVDSYQIVREHHPNGIIFANLGAEHSVENGKKAVDLLKADALQIHLNAPQELVMPEGSKQFSTWLDSIQKMVKEVGVPVIVKEVGFGMSQETIATLKNCGVTTIDVSGQGGTNFVEIENERRKRKEFHYLEDWGQSTVLSLLEASSYTTELDILASGGIQTPVQVVKSLVLGAKSCGVAGYFLHYYLKEGIEATIAEIETWKEVIKLLMTLTSSQSVADLPKASFVLDSYLVNWCQQRQLTAIPFC